MLHERRCFPSLDQPSTINHQPFARTRLRGGSSMARLQLPIRYYRAYAPCYDYGYETIELDKVETAFLLVDVDGGAPNPVTECFIAPALEAARELGLLVTYVHNDLRLVADPGNIVGEGGGRTKGSGLGGL